LAYDGLCTFEFAIATEVFGLDRPEFGDDWYRFRVISIEPARAVAARGGIAIKAQGSLKELRTADLIIVPGWRDSNAEVPLELRRELLAASRRGARIASICSGVFVLAQCGLLDGRSATTHWRYSSDLSERFPAIRVKPDVLYVDEGCVLTSAGSAAGLDLCLHIVRKDFGVERANDVARRLVMPAHRSGGQAQFITKPLARISRNSISDLLDTLRRRLDEEWTIERIAGAAHVSRRTLLRRFRDATNQSPQEWLVAERVERAKELLETTAVDLKEIASASGFRSPESFRHHFRLRVGASPSGYRASFGIGRDDAEATKERARRLGSRSRKHH